MKKYLILILCLMIALSAAACSPDNAKKKGAGDNAPSQGEEPTVWQPKDKQNTKPTIEREKPSRSDSTLYSAAPSEEDLDALDTALYYLEEDNYSYKYLIRCLEDAGYSYKAAVYAAAHCDADWKEQAYETALSYAYQWDSDYDDMVEYLLSMEFTKEEAEYAASELYPDDGGSSDREDAVALAQYYVDYYPYSRGGIIYQLREEGFSKADAVYAADHIDVDWYDEAEESAADELKYKKFTHDELVDKLVYLGFTKQEAEYGVACNGI